MVIKLLSVVPDTSILIDRVLTTKIKQGELELSTILIHHASLAELEHQANETRSIGFLGLAEIKELRELAKQKNIQFELIGARPRAAEIHNAGYGEIDALIRQGALEAGATLITSDKVQAAVAEAQDIPVLYIEPHIQTKKKLKLDEFFDYATMSVHLREDLPPMAKRGLPGNWAFVSIKDIPLTSSDIQDISNDILEEAKSRRDGFIEIERAGSTIVQLGDYRIVITRPPFSDGWEITAARPIKKLDLASYTMSEKLRQRLTTQAEGILISGRPGEGKSTFARALAEHYAAQSKIVKTVESPRDMLLSAGITQYSISKGTSDEVHDVLLLSRPDATIFDEMRNTKDFELFTDLRLAGIGMAGVVHATDPIDAVQRFLSRVELGIIPHIIDTILYIKSGQIAATLSLSMKVKVPTGMAEADLARPVVEVHDFESGELKYEIYTYGEQTVIIPIQKSVRRSQTQKLAEEAIKSHMQKYVEKCEVEVKSDNRATLYIPEHDIPRIIGKEGQQIQKIEQDIGIGIDIEELRTAPQKKHEEIKYSIDIKKNNIIFFLEQNMANRNAEIYYDEEMLALVKVGKKAAIKFRRDSPVGEKIMKALDTGKLRLVA